MKNNKAEIKCERCKRKNIALNNGECMSCVLNISKPSQPEDISDKKGHLEGHIGNIEIIRELEPEWEKSFNRYYGLMFEAGDYEQLVNDIKSLLLKQKQKDYEEMERIIGELHDKWLDEYHLQKPISHKLAGQVYATNILLAELRERTGGGK